MPGTSVTTVLDTVTSDTLDRIRPGLTDSVFETFPFTAYLMQKGKVVARGGNNIRYRTMYAKNLTARSIGRGGTVSLAPTDPVTMAIYDWKRVVTNITRYSMDDKKNSGDLAVANYIEDLLENAKLSLQDLMEEQLCGSGTGDDFLGLQNIIANDPSVSVEVGTINQSTKPWWRSVQATSSGIAATFLMSDTRHMFNTLSLGSRDRAPDFMFTDQTVYELFEDEMYGLLMLRNQKMVDAGFPENIMFRGATLTFGGQCYPGNLYFLNSRYVELVVNSSGFERTDWKEPPNQVGDRALQLYLDGNFTTKRRCVLGVITGNSAT